MPVTHAFFMSSHEVALLAAAVGGDDEDSAVGNTIVADDFDFLGPPPTMHPSLLRASAMDCTLATCAPLTASQVQESMAWCTPYTLTR
ncbi:hypothetical protein DYB37_010025 [Aphanomyces astaci]|uniref:Uncharacterized protein n=1 Tax=Aphanomyces astaci TaxID=112090 RepID=A0A3R6ZZ20_APHAT|nr:hypothetical protein DYB35_009503 [Aphanomyces astaci]RHZ27918.1 hypothetical protein DYB37_010025 [Aphanomyces astaci]